MSDHTSDKNNGTDETHPSPDPSDIKEKSTSSVTSASTCTSSTILIPFTIASSYGKKCKSRCSSLFNCYGDPEAKAIALSHIPRGASFCVYSVYFSAAMLKIASIEAGCEVDSQKEFGNTAAPDCDKKILGLKPSSLLAIYVMIAGLCTSLFLPIVGAILDSSNHRRNTGRIVSTLLSICTFSASFVSQENWVFMLVLLLFISVFLEIEYCIVLAYVPELTNDDAKLTHFNVLFATCSNLSVLTFLVVMTLVTTFLPGAGDTIVAARIAMTLNFVLQLICYGYAWTLLFGPRKARNSINQNQGQCSVIVTGLKRVGLTICQVFHQQKEVKWCLITRMVTQAASISFFVALLAYLTDTIKVSPRDLGIATLIFVGSAVPGNLLSVPMTKWFNPLRSLQLCLLVLGGFIVALPFVVSGPGSEPLLFVMSVGYGLNLGWKEPTEKTLWCRLIPHRQEAEMWGLYLFSGQIFTWFPPLIFTVLNESSASIQVALASYGGYFLIGVIFLFFMGNYESVQAHLNALNQEIDASIEEKDRDEIVIADIKLSSKLPEYSPVDVEV